VVALAALGQERQLASHARGSLRCGATRAELDAALECVADLVEPKRMEQARRIVDRFA
jgi:alkylhydroperoxidase/carboxymuconolactone decarboxylase family protein YurZ